MRKIIRMIRLYEAKIEMFLIHEYSQSASINESLFYYKKYVEVSTAKLLSLEVSIT